MRSAETCLTCNLLSLLTLIIITNIVADGDHDNNAPLTSNAINYLLSSRLLKSFHVVNRI